MSTTDQLECYKCHEQKNLSELSRHDAYKDRLRYICKTCNSERIALKRNMQKLRKVPPMYPQNEVSVSPKIKPVHTPYIASSREEAQQIVYANRARIAKLLEERMTTPSI